MTDTQLLREKIGESGYKVAFISEKCGLTYQGFLNKVKGRSEFNADEIRSLRDVLSLSMEDVERIFFAEEVDRISTLA